MVLFQVGFGTHQDRTALHRPSLPRNVHQCQIMTASFLPIDSKQPNPTLFSATAVPNDNDLATSLKLRYSRWSSWLSLRGRRSKGEGRRGIRRATREGSFLFPSPSLPSRVARALDSPSFYPFPRTATGTRTPQNNGLNEQKQSLCTCVLHSGTFLCRPLQYNNVKWLNFRFSRERERMTQKLLSFSLLWRRSY